MITLKKKSGKRIMPKNFRAVHILKFLEEEHSEDGLPITLPCYAERVPITYLLNFIISVK